MFILSMSLISKAFAPDSIFGRDIAEYNGSKWSKYQRYRIEGGFIFHVATDTLKLTITPPDAKLGAKLAKKVKSERGIRDTFDVKVTGIPTMLDKQSTKLVPA